MKVLFLDRDGIINLERGDYTWLISDFKFTSNLEGFLKNCIQQGFKIIVITNQGGIDKGLYSGKDVEQLHGYMINRLQKMGIEILDVYYCPHHSDFQKCLCRKPGSLLLERAVAVYSVDKSLSLMIGDRQRDVDAAESIGIQGILLDSNPDWDQFNLQSYLK